MKKLAEQALFLLEGRPPEPDAISLIVACVLLTMMDTKKPGWLDWFCLVMALGNLRFIFIAGGVIGLGRAAGTPS